MATTHVFIVDAYTFKYHLEYQFAGTGAEEHRIDFNGSRTTKLHHKTEDNLVGMMADSQRIRKGDYVIFYLRQNFSRGIFEGKFYGIFKTKEDLAFLDNNDKEQFLKNELRKSLTFRIIIEPYQVYAKGVTEWEALDEIKQIHSPNQMLWSLIYRKLKGNRGNTMITIYEEERLFKLIRDKNHRHILNANRLTFDFDKQEITSDSAIHTYVGRKEPINILPRLLDKYQNGRLFEAHLQAYVVQNIGRNTNQSLDNCLLNGLPSEWIGNEVSCGVGMQRIDIMLSLISSNTRIAVPIELKATQATVRSIIQIQRYVDWLEQYYIPNRISDVQPVLISKRVENKRKILYSDIIDDFAKFNTKNDRCLPLKYVEYSLIGNSLQFNVENY